MAEQSQINAERLRLARAMAFPADDLMLNRMGLGVVAVLGQLDVTRNWHRIAREYWFGDDPATDLGRAEHAFWAAKRVKPILPRKPNVPPSPL